MSLIQEALRRKEADETQRSKVALRSVPGIPPRESLGKNHKDDPRSALWVGLGIGFAVLIVGVVLLVMVVRSRTEKVAAKNPQTLVVAEPDPAGKAAAPPAARIDKTVLPETEQPAPVPASKEDVANEVTGVSPEALEARERALAEQSARELLDSTPMNADQWPVLRVTGVLTRNRGQDHAAIVNGDILVPGDRVQGVVIDEVTHTGVWMIYNEERRFVRTGRTTTEAE
jgi:hypothetical protein